MHTVMANPTTFRHAEQPRAKVIYTVERLRSISASGYDLCSSLSIDKFCVVPAPDRCLHTATLIVCDTEPVVAPRCDVSRQPRLG